MDGRSAKPKFGLSGDRDIDKQAQHMHHYRSTAQRGHHVTHIRQLRHRATGASEYLSYHLPLLESGAALTKPWPLPSRFSAALITK